MTLRIISSASVRSSEEEEGGSPDIGAEPRGVSSVSTTATLQAAVHRSVGVRRLRLGERPGEAHLLRGEVDTREMRHAGVSPLL